MEFSDHVSSARDKRIATKSSIFFPPLIQRHFPDGIVISEPVRRAVMVASKKPSIPVLITGETGTGKEEVARFIHRERCKGEGELPFIPVNCSHLNSQIAESLLFGHIRGSFSGAERSTRGLISEANGGILFLDEIHTLTTDNQQKLLRVLNDGTFMQVGSTKILRSDFQLLVASTRDLARQAEEGMFLPDLYGRIWGLSIALPPLRERAGELPALISLYFEKRGIHLSDLEINALSERCSGYTWPQNIRQLYRSLDLLTAEAEVFQVPVLAKNLRIQGDRAPFGSLNTPTQKGHPLPESGMPLPGPGAFSRAESEVFEALKRSLSQDIPISRTLASVEKLILKKSMERHQNLSGAYKALGLSRSAFDSRRKKYGFLTTGPQSSEPSASGAFLEPDQQV